MRTRTEIKLEQEKVIEQINSLKKKARELYEEDLMLSDDKRRFEEKVEHHDRPKYARKPHFYDGKKVGRIYWTETFTDEKGHSMKIDRQMAVRVDGEWIV